jgi:hypothetical protein
VFSRIIIEDSDFRELPLVRHQQINGRGLLPKTDEGITRNQRLPNRRLLKSSAMEDSSQNLEAAGGVCRSIQRHRALLIQGDKEQQRDRDFKSLVVIAACGDWNHCDAASTRLLIEDLQSPLSKTKDRLPFTSIRRFRPWSSGSGVTLPGDLKSNGAVG